MKKDNSEDNRVFTKEEIETTPRLADLHEALVKLQELCRVEPYASIICTIHVPTEPIPMITSIYAGDTQTQVNLINMMAENHPEFLNDLQLFLAHRIKTQIKTHGTSGNTLADQMLAKLNEAKLNN